MDVERRTAVIYKCTDAVLLYFASLVMVMMVVMFMLIMVVFLVMLVGFVVMSVCVSLPFLFLGSLLLDAANPSCRHCHFFKIKQMRVDYLIQIHFRIITFNDFSPRLQRPYYLLDAFQLFRLYFRSLVQQNDIAELDLLDNQIFNIFLINVFARQVIAAGKFALQTQRIDYGHDAIQTANTILDVCTSHRRDRANGLCYRFRFADAACLDYDIVETL